MIQTNKNSQSPLFREILDQSLDSFDRITRLAQHLLPSSSCFIVVTESNESWLVSAAGCNDDIRAPSTLEGNFHSLNSPLIIEDTTLDTSASSHPAMTIAPHSRFLALLPFNIDSSDTRGLLVIADSSPRSISPSLKQSYLDLSYLAASEVEHNLLLQIRNELKHSEHALRIENERLALATHAGNIGIWEYNILTNELNWDDRMFELYGIQRDQFPGEYEAWSHALHPDDKARSEQELNDAIQGVKPFNTEFRVIWKNGEIHYIHAAANIIKDSLGRVERMIGVNHDITQRKKMDEAGKQFQSIIQSSDDAIMSKSLDGIITSWNPAAESMFGYSSEEAIGQPVLILFPEETPKEEQMLINRISTGEKIENFETVHQHKDGSLVDVSVTVSPIFDDAGEVIGASRIARDISERKKLDRMKSEFISTVSHELRTPLTSIRGALGLILGKSASQLPPKVASMLQMANRNAERLSLLVNDILDLEKIQSGALQLKLERIDLVELLKQSYEENTGFASKHHVSLELNLETESVFTYGDEKRLMQVLANLISNAVKFSPEKETVQLSITAMDEYAEISVKDYGPGIPEDFQSRIFQRFAQADSSDTREKSGTGLGLSISRAIIERHNGIIDYETDAEKGTQFYFRLPVATDEYSIPSSNSLHTPARRALICEDNLDVAEILRTILASEGIHSDIATLVSEARTLAMRHNYDLLILDLKLPDGNGIDLLHELDNSHSNEKLPVIIVSGAAEESRDKYLGNSDMIVDWLQKPIRQNRLREAILNIQYNRPHILHVDDDLDIIQVTNSLVKNFAHIDHATTLAEARTLLEGNSYNLVILDIMLPDGQGDQLLDAGDINCPCIIFSSHQPDFDHPCIKATMNKSISNINQLRDSILAALTPQQWNDS